jgi:hypothetical protein
MLDATTISATADNNLIFTRHLHEMFYASAQPGIDIVMVSRKAKAPALPESSSASSIAMTAARF